MKQRLLNVTSSSFQREVRARWDTEWDACGGRFSQQLYWAGKRKVKSLLRETKKPGEAGFSRDVQGHEEKVLLSISRRCFGRRAVLCWGRDGGVTRWHWHGIEEQQGGNEIGGERSGVVFLPSPCSGEGVSGVRQLPQ